jgi:hypothetical protein
MPLLYPDVSSTASVGHAAAARRAGRGIGRVAGAESAAAQGPERLWRSTSAAKVVSALQISRVAPSGCAQGKRLGITDSQRLIAGSTVPERRARQLRQKEPRADRFQRGPDRRSGRGFDDRCAGGASAGSRTVPGSSGSPTERNQSGPCGAISARFATTPWKPAAAA